MLTQIVRLNFRNSVKITKLNGLIKLLVEYCYESMFYMIDHVLYPMSDFIYFNDCY